MANLQQIWLSQNQLSGSIPPDLGNLANLQDLSLSENQLRGMLPRSLMNLGLYLFYFNDTNLCEPSDAAFQAWLAGIPYLQRTSVLCRSFYLPLCLHG
jgi:hypothetical protein